MGDYYQAELEVYGYAKIEDLPKPVREEMFILAEDGKLAPGVEDWGGDDYMSIIDNQARGGIYQWHEDEGDLPRVLQEAGIAFHMSDQGYYEFPPESLRWAPDMVRAESDEDYAVLKAAGFRLSENGENPEYDRAIVEMTTDVVSGGDVRERILKVKEVELRKAAEKEAENASA